MDKIVESTRKIIICDDCNGVGKTNELTRELLLMKANTLNATHVKEVED